MQDMMSKLKRVNPGWTSDWAPKDMVNTLRAYRMLTVDDKGVLSLTDDGKEWANRINWKPESLVKEDEPATAGSAEPESPKDDPLVVMPASPPACILAGVRCGRSGWRRPRRSRKPEEGGDRSSAPRSRRKSAGSAPAPPRRERGRPRRAFPRPPLAPASSDYDCQPNAFPTVDEQKKVAMRHAAA